MEETLKQNSLHHEPERQDEFIHLNDGASHSAFLGKSQQMMLRCYLHTDCIGILAKHHQKDSCFMSFLLVTSMEHH